MLGGQERVMVERQSLGQRLRIASTPGGIDPLNHRQQRPAPVGCLSSQAYSQARAQHGSLRREGVERTSLQRCDALGLSHKPMLSHPHATETECGTSEGYCVACSLSHMRCAVKEGTRL